MRMTPRLWQQTVIALLLAIFACAVVNGAIIAFLMKRGASFDSALEGSGLLLTPRLRSVTGIDSWRPMAHAYVHNQKAPGELYWVFLVKHIKFQYPPSSLLALKLWPQPVVFPITAELRQTLALPSLIAVLVTIACSAALLLLLTAQLAADTLPRLSPYALVSVALTVGLGVTYYPLTKGHSLGQIQVYLGMMAAAALLLQTIGRRELSGALLGVCCLVKPQWGIVVLWALLRKENRFLLGFGLVASLGLALSLHEFGLANHVKYLEVLKVLSRQGEAYGPNQSVNGLVQRWLGNGSAIKFESRGLPPYNPIVYYSTVVSSLVAVALALFWPTAAKHRGDAIDLAVVMCAATLASPIAWEHHYGAFLPVFAVALPVTLHTHRRRYWLLLSYALMANEFTRPDLTFTDRWSGLLGSHILFGALLLFGIVLAARAPEARTASSPDDATSNAPPRVDSVL